tara:strand:+ start:212 stop:568 length:357 start_codon:yes stop_codon:yes gene_type:complete
MNYSQKANPNATNSELDAKRIITHKQLTSAQRDELIEQFVEIQLDNMDTQSLYELASEYVTQSFDRLTDNEIKERIESLYDEELYDELVDNVTQQYPKQLNTFEKQTFIDINNTGGKF